MSAPPPPPGPPAPGPPAPPPPTQPEAKVDDKLEKVKKLAQKSVDELELWSWKDPYLPKAMLAARKRAEKPLLDQFMQEELQK
mmetsp:Transcript_3116/g.3522  ORF Transcript_3116/g.3522 Transcript_3116/m.3522 type:complete len:83 (-) Transcript_3116:253-501(-)